MLEGDRSKGKGKRRGMPPEARQPEQCPEPPERLSAYAAEEWRAVAPELHRLGLLTVLDVTVLSAYCTAAGQLREAEEQMVGQPLTVTTPTGQQRSHPLLHIASQAKADMAKLAGHLGLSPISRLRLTGAVPPKDRPSKFDGLLGA
jgi:P27 family predicted phage terminase small subunit